MVGVARADAWKDAYSRFRSVRDGIEGGDVSPAP
jgi:hypothetical protein